MSMKLDTQCIFLHRHAVMQSLRRFAQECVANQLVNHGSDQLRVLTSVAVQIA
jgi:hypothetical protein